MVIEYELNNKIFSVAVVQSAQNLLKPGFQCTCNTIKSNIESNLSAAIKACYQKVFKTKTEYSGPAIIGFNITITSIGNLDKNKFYRVGTGFVSLFTIHYCDAQRLFVLKIKKEQCNLEIYLELECTHQFIGQTPDDVWNKLYSPGAPLLQKLKRTASRLTNIQKEQFLSFFQDRDNVIMSSYYTDSKESPILYLRNQKSEIWKKFYKTYPDGMKRTSFIARLADSENLKYHQDLGGLCIICHDYGYDTFDNLENII
ncbi:28554_t:CDS:2, partial [Racocetra persica]